MGVEGLEGWCCRAVLKSGPDGAGADWLCWSGAMKRGDEKGVLKGGADERR